LLVERLHELREVEQAAAESVHLVDDHAVHPAGFDVRQQSLEGRAVSVAAGEPAVVVPVRQAVPALGPLAGDVRLGGLPLGVE
jgi:hypothetical protein